MWARKFGADGWESPTSACKLPQFPAEFFSTFYSTIVRN